MKNQQWVSAFTLGLGLALVGCSKQEAPPTTNPAESATKPGAADRVGTTEKAATDAAKAASKQESKPTAAPATPASSPSASQGGAPAKTGADTGKVMAKHPWGSFKVDSYVKTKAVSTTKLPGMDSEERTSETTQTLVALDSENATLKTQVKEGGVEVPAMEMKVPLRAQTPTDPVAVKTTGEVKTRDLGTEKLSIGGKTLTCKVTEAKTAVEGNTTTMTTWMCEDIPGFVAKTVSKTIGNNMEMSSTSEVVEFAAK